MASSAAGLITPVQVYYDKVFLDRAKIELRHDFGAQVKNVPLNSGAVVRWTRFSPLALITSALSEATNPGEVAMTATQVSATLAEYGNVTNVSSLFSMTQIDVDLKEHIEVHGQNAGESIDQLIRNELHSGATKQVVTGTYGNPSAPNISDIHMTDIFTGLEIRRAVRTLKLNKAQRFESGLYRGIIGPANSYDLYGNSEWLDAHRYTTSDAIERGVVGKLHGVEFVETNNQYVTLSGGFSGTPVTAASAGVANVYETFIFGKNAYGVVNLGSITAPTVIVKNPGPNDTSNPLNMFSTVGWKMPFATKTLNSNWIVAIQSSTSGANTATF
jgi:N4-gp56 family major capsid protein